ncbi:MAG: ABC transporter permease [Bacteroidota bacterium]
MNKSSHPKYLLHLFRWFCHPDLHPFIEGDLLELYEERVEEHGRWTANIRLTLDILLLFRPSIIRLFNQPQSVNHTAMFKNYFTIGWRNIRKGYGYTLINIGGLSLGMMCCMLLWLYFQHESSFDKHHQHADQLYLVNSTAVASGNQKEFPMLSAIYAEALKEDLPEIAQTTRMIATPMSESRTLLQIQREDHTLHSLYETNGYYVDSTFFDMFTYQFTEGNAQAALLDPHAVVLSDQVARKIFGQDAALGKIIRIKGSLGKDEDFTVTGVYQDESSRSHIDARFFVSTSAGQSGDFLRSFKHNFASNNIFYTYVRLHPEASAVALERKLSAFMDKYAREDLKAAGFDKQLSLIPVSDIHLYDSLSSIVTPTSSLTYLYLLASIGLLILLIACINFMNLTTARSTRRAIEVGVRKVVGAERKVLIQQFLVESILMALLALLPAWVLSVLLLPLFNQLSGKAIDTTALFDGEMMGASVVLLLITGLIAGSYPAFYLSVFKPVRVLKGNFANTIAATTLRKSLVVFQFVIAVGLISATLVIYQQMEFIRDKPLGFDSEQQLVIPLLSEEVRQSYTVLRNELAQDSRVQEVAGAMFYPGISNPNSISVYRSDQTVEDIQPVKTNGVSSRFLSTMGFQLLEGQWLPSQASEEVANQLVVNQATLKALSVPLEEAIGQQLYFDWQDSTYTYEIIGVVEDFHYEGLQHEIQPYAFRLGIAPYFHYLIAKFSTDDVSDLLAFTEQTWKEANPNAPFEFSFIQDDLQKNYLAEERVLRIITTFTIVSIFISCLGLFGLSTFAAQQRRKEIGIRKVLGASLKSIVALLSQEYIKLVLLAIVMAIPLAWYTMSRWLQSFAYQMDMPWGMFGLTAMLAITVAIGTISFQSIRAATANPVESLRDE